LRYLGESREVSWRKSSASDTRECVEVASIGSAVFVQDSKNADGGPVITLSATAWRTLVSTVRSGRHG
jgi:hypothetical protein